MAKVLVILSGGQDSTTCLYWAIDKFGLGNVSTVTFDYGQRHRVELHCAKTIADKAGVGHVVLPIDTFAALGGNSLIDRDINVPSTTEQGSALPNTFVPGRNLIFITFAAALGYLNDIDHLVIGVSQADYSGYPDCRQATLDALQEALRLGLERDIRIHAPLIQLSKKQTVELAVSLGALAAMADTHTCYNGQRPPCGHCPACQLRAKGFAEAGLSDPVLTVG